MGLDVTGQSVQNCSLENCSNVSLPEDVLTGFQKWIGGSHYHVIQAGVTSYLVVMLVFGLVGNLLIVVPFIKSKKLRRATSNVFIVHLAVVNIINISVGYPIILTHLWLPPELNFFYSLYNCVSVYLIFDMLFLCPAFFSMLCVAVNRCLLIKSPQKMFPRYCHRRAITAILIMMYSLLVLREGLKLAYLDVIVEPYCTIKGLTEKWVVYLEYFFESLFIYTPIFVIPLCHAIIICTIRNSRKRVTSIKDKAMNSSMHIVLSNESGTGAPSVSAAFNVGEIEMSGVGYHEMEEAACYSRGCATNPSFRKISAPISTLSEHGNTTEMQQYVLKAIILKGEGSLQPGREKCISPNSKSRHLDSVSDTGHLKPMKVKTQPSFHNSNKAEIRLVKMMIVMYIIMLLPLAANFVVGNFTADNQQLLFLMSVMGELVPFCHAIVPFIYLWGNRNYHEVLKSLPILRLCCHD